MQSLQLARQQDRVVDSSINQPIADSLTGNLSISTDSICQIKVKSLPLRPPSPIADRRFTKSGKCRAAVQTLVQSVIPES